MFGNNFDLFLEKYWSCLYNWVEKFESTSWAFKIAEGLWVLRKQERKKETPLKIFVYFCLVCKKMWTVLVSVKCLCKTYVRSISHVLGLFNRKWPRALENVSRRVSEWFGSCKIQFGLSWPEKGAYIFHQLWSFLGKKCQHYQKK